jgi:hypothetical protein
MSYVASQIAIWIVLSVLFGFAVGWLARSRRDAPVRKRRRF